MEWNNSFLQERIMAPENVDEFINWFDSELDKLHLSDYQFAAKAGITHPVISKARKGKLPGWDACLAIATALHVDPIEVFRLAGLLPKRANAKPELERLKFMCENLPDVYIPIVIKILKALSEE